MIKLQSAKTEQLDELGLLANQVWHQAYDGLLGVEQVDYMVMEFQSKNAFEEQIQAGYEYYFIVEDGTIYGYLAIVQQESQMFLSKLYLKSEHYGKGIAQVVLNWVKKECVERDISKLYLTVNKGNARAIKAYERFGFKRTDAIVTDIGNGFVMDDYVYKLNI